MRIFNLTFSSESECGVAFGKILCVDPVPTQAIGKGLFHVLVDFSQWPGRSMGHE